MAQRTPFLAFEFWTLNPRDDDVVFAQGQSNRFPQSVTRKHNRCRFRNLFPYAVPDNKYGTESFF